jgi:SAM-dependent methyltransferase
MIEENILIGKNVLEIGGPSKLLNPYYELCKTTSFLNLNISKSVHSQDVFPKNNISSYDGDACDPNTFKKYSLFDNFDLLLSSHTLEHFANPLKTLFLWKSCLKTGGKIITIVPNKNFCWDRNRFYTSFQHILDDYENKIEENDMTHLDESSCMVETRPSYFENVGASNSTRIIHHHVFSTEILSLCHEYCGFSTTKCFIYEKDPLQMVYIGHKNE